MFLLVFTVRLFFFNSSDKNKCYDMIKKLSDTHQSEKEYLKVCESITLKYVLYSFHSYEPFSCSHKDG